MCMKNESRRNVNMFSALEVANLCGVVNQTAINWIKSGYLKAFNTPGGQYRVYYEDLIEFIKERGMKIPKELEERSKEQAHWNSLMVIDDDTVLNDGIVSYLNKNIPGLTIYQSFNGFDAGAQLVKYKPGFIILDINLPGVDGKQICKEIKEDESFGNPYIIAITGLEDAELQNHMEDLGANAFFKKPVDFSKLLDEINGVIG